MFLLSNPPSEALCSGGASSPSNLPSPLLSTTRRFSECSASPNLSPPDIPNNSIDILETSSAEFSTPTAEPIKRSKSTPKRKKAAANSGMKIYSDDTANPWQTSARRNSTVKKSTFTVFKVNSVPIRNNDELLKAVENRQAFIKNKQRLICSYENYKSQLLKMKSLPEIISINSSQFNKYFS